MSKNKQFDTRFKEKIGEVSTNPLYGSWDTFQKKWRGADLQGPGVTDTEFDARIKSRLVHIKSALPSGHWQKLKYRLETIEIFREKIIIHKCKEVAAVALFVFTFFNVIHFQQKDTFHDSPDYAMENGVGIKEKSPVSFRKEKKQAGQTGFISRKAKSQILPVENVSADVSGIALAVDRNISKINILLPSENNAFVASKVYPTWFNRTSSKQNHEDYSILTVKKGETYSETAPVFPMSASPDNVTNMTTRVGIFVNKMHNFILTPFDKVYSVPEFSKSTNNFGYGVSFSKKRGPVEMETGASYARLNYRPVEIRETFASAADVYFETSLKSIQFDLVKIPLHLKYFAVDKNNWKFYLLGGTSLNLLANAEYTIEENLVKGRPVSPYRFSNDGPRLEDKPFTYGFFDAGNFRENYYVDVSMGIGMELRIGRDIHFYCQPAYHAFVFSDEIGIGPNQDKLNAFEVQTGFKWTLSQ